MSNHTAKIVWSVEGDFKANEYTRGHLWVFDGGAEVAASASPDVVPVPFSKPEAVDPEEAFIASLSSCHMLWFLDFARRAGFEVLSYEDEARGTMKNSGGMIWIPKVELHPKTQFAGLAPTPDQLSDLHHKAHDACFIANSVKTDVVTVLD